MQQPPNPSQHYPQFQQPPQQPWQQPDYTQPQAYQQLHTGYPQLQPQPQPPKYPPPPQFYQQPIPPPSRPPRDKRRERKEIIVTVSIILSILCLALGVSLMYMASNHIASTPTTTGGVNTNSTQPAQVAQATPSPIPTIAPISLSGVGQQASSKFQLQQGLAIFKLTHNGTSNFIVDILDSNGQEVDNLVNVIGSFNGSKAEGIQNAGSYLLNIQADGKWMISITHEIRNEILASEQKMRSMFL